MKNGNNTKKYILMLSSLVVMLVVAIPVFAQANYYAPYYGYGYGYGYGFVSDGSYSGGGYEASTPAPEYYDENGTVSDGSYSGGGITYGEPTGDLSGTCSPNVTSAEINSPVTWTATASGGNGIYTFSWSGQTDSDLSASGQSVTTSYTQTGVQDTSVVISSDGETTVATCSVDITADPIQVLAYTNSNPTLTEIPLTQVPYTGAGDIVRVIAFIVGIVLWSLLLAYFFLKRKANAAYAFEAQEQTIPAPVSEEIPSDQQDILHVEDYARSQKVLLSSDAAIRLVKLQRLGTANAKEIINNFRAEDWTAVGEKDLEKYL